MQTSSSEDWNPVAIGNKPVHKIMVLQPGVLLIADCSFEVIKGVTGI